MLIQQHRSGLLDSNTYVLIEADHGMVIDPFTKFVVNEKLIIDYILLTHEHYDHIAGVKTWKRLTGAKVVCSETCAQNIINPKKNLARYFDYLCETQTWVKKQDTSIIDKDYACSADLTFKGEYVFEWQDHTIRLTEMPGHAAGAVGIFVDGEHFFSGDNMIPGFEIELRFPGGSKTDWQEKTLPLLERLPAGIMVHPGHFESFVYAGEIGEYI